MWGEHTNAMSLDAVPGRCRVRAGRMTSFGWRIGNKGKSQFSAPAGQGNVLVTTRRSHGIEIQPNLAEGMFVSENQASGSAGRELGPGLAHLQARAPCSVVLPVLASFVPDGAPQGFSQVPLSAVSASRGCCHHGPFVGLKQ